MLSTFLGQFRDYEQTIKTGSEEEIEEAESRARDLIRAVKPMMSRHAPCVARIRKAVKLPPVLPPKVPVSKVAVSIDAPSAGLPPPPGPGLPPPPGPGVPPAPGNAGPPPPGLAGAIAPKADNDEYVSKAFKQGLSSDMFVLPESMSPADLKASVLRYNYALKQNRGNEEEALDKLNIKVRNTSKVDASKIEDYTGILWDLKFGAGGDIPELPSADELEALHEKEKWNFAKGKDWNVEDARQKGRLEEASDSRINIENPKEAFINSAKIEEINRQLDAAGSFVKLVADGKPGKDGFVAIKPVWNDTRPITPATVKGEDHSKLLKINSEERDALPGDGYITWADCHRTAQSIMGSLDTPSGILDSEGVSLAGFDKPIKPIEKNKIKSIRSATDHGANRAMHAAFNAAIPEFISDLLDDAKEVAFGKLSGDDAKAEVQRREKAKETPDLIPLLKLAVSLQKKTEAAEYDGVVDLHRTYSKICDDPDLREAFVKKYCLNEAIEPKVGCILTIVNDEAEKAEKELREGDERIDLWNFHFAGIVMVNDDGSYMTLENMSTEDNTAINDNWFFALYEPGGDKSFHSIYSSDPGFGDGPITLMLDKVA